VYLTFVRNNEAPHMSGKTEPTT